MHLGNGRYLLHELPYEHLVIYTGGHKLAVFNEKGTACACCGDVGIHLVVTVNHNGTQKQIELYTDDWVAMTVDHIVPKSRGGLNHIDNYQPLCRWCNAIKSDKNMTTEELRQMISYKYKNL